MAFDVKEVVTRSKDSGATVKVFKAFTPKMLAAPIAKWTLLAIAFLVMLTTPVYLSDFIHTELFSDVIRYKDTDPLTLVGMSMAWAFTMTLIIIFCVEGFDKFSCAISEWFEGDKKVDNKIDQNIENTPSELNPDHKGKALRVRRKSCFKNHVAPIAIWASLLFISHEAAEMTSSLGYSFISVNPVWFGNATLLNDLGQLDQLANMILWLFLLRTISEWFMGSLSRALIDGKVQNAMQARNTAENRILHKSSPRVRMLLGLTVVFITAATGYSFILFGKSV